MSNHSMELIYEGILGKTSQTNESMANIWLDKIKTDISVALNRGIPAKDVQIEIEKLKNLLAEFNINKLPVDPLNDYNPSNHTKEMQRDAKNEKMYKQQGVEQYLPSKK